MKYAKYLMSLLSAALLSVGCKSDIEHVQLLPESEFPELELTYNGGDLTINSANSSETVVFNCNSVSFGAGTMVKYQLYLSGGDMNEDGTYADETLLATSNSNTIMVLKSYINTIALNSLKIEAWQTGTVYAYARAYVGESDLCTGNSAPVQFAVTTFLPPISTIYIVGSFNGWNPSVGSMLENKAGTDVYSGVYLFTQNDWDGATPNSSNFRFLKTQGDWSSDIKSNAIGKLSDEISPVPGDNDGNMMIAPGIWEVTIDLKGSKEVSARSLDRMFICGGFDGWGRYPDAETGDGGIDLIYNSAKNVWYSSEPVAAGVEFKVCYATEPTTNAITWLGGGGAATMLPASLPEGVTAYELNGGDNIVSEGGYILVYADRTPWLFAYVNDLGDIDVNGGE